MSSQSKLAKILVFPLTRIILGIIFCILVLITSQLMIKVLPFNPSYKNLITSIFTGIMVLLGYKYLFAFYEKRKITELALKVFLKNAILGFVIGTLLQVLVVFIIYLFGSYEITKINPVSFLIPALSVSISAGIVEELVFRGIIFRIAEEKLGSALALAISAIIFGFGHILNDNSTIWSATAISIEAGILLGTAYMYTRNLWLPIFLHFAWNFTEGGILGVPLSGNTLSQTLISCKVDGHTLITGGAFGPEAAIQTVFFCLIVATFFLWKAHQKGNFIRPYWLNKKN